MLSVKVNGLFLLFIMGTLIAGPAHKASVSSSTGNLKDLQYKNNLLNKISELIKTRYVLSDQASGYSAEFDEKIRSGVYSDVVDVHEFAEKITEDIQAITGDKHVSLRVISASEAGEKKLGALHHPVRFSRLIRKENTGFQKLEWINGHIGYLEIRRFTILEIAREKMEAAMKFLKDADAVIIDVRENGGGSGDYLSSFFLPYPTQLTGCYYREGDYIQEDWTSREMCGSPMTEVPLFVLIGKNTFSAAEAFAYNLQAVRRAILIGEPTRGGAHSIDLIKIDDQFEINISTGRAVHPVTKTNWEGKGVIPDVTTTPEEALNTAVDMAEKAGLKFAEARDDRIKDAVGRMQVQLDRAEKSYRDDEFRSGGSALDELFRIGVEAGLMDEFFVMVLVYHYFSDKANPIITGILERGIVNFPHWSRGHVILADVLLESGKKECALLQYEKALQLDPYNITLQKKLIRLKSQVREVGFEKKPEKAEPF